MEKKVESISAIWLSKEKTTIEQCSKKVYDFLLLLRVYNNDLFGHWYEKGNSKKEAINNQVDFNQDYFKRDLEKKWDKKFEDLGARISYWSGNKNDSESAQINFNIGAYGDKSFNKNSCILTLPENDKFFSSAKEIDDLINLMKNYWKPNKMLINGIMYQI
ncbi:Imm52 family immunity protein [Flavobacterium macrobrachii]|uniref:Immunity protein 52 domain-containing protein n=1 Tax=Flavobacterium macrobrachii TaxID=591204 RepID=A0ABS2CT98_9FLAO|nr:Imm52 family immunity protein [Flavobacterium macrobrachii]MBM6498163.1 hypothetical protein [Flavobacterium macrobrachii]